jgi:hypothetical protein
MLVGIVIVVGFVFICTGERWVIRDRFVQERIDIYLNRWPFVLSLDW